MSGVVGSATSRPMISRRTVSNVLSYLVLIAVGLVVLFPIYAAVVNSLLRTEQLLSPESHLFPSDPQWGNYSEVMRGGELNEYLRNSAIVAIAITAAQLLTSILAAYGFAFMRFPLRRTMFVVFLATLMVPIEVTVIANFQTIDSWGWVNSYQSLIVPFTATALGTFLLRQAFLEIPRELRDAARMDGLGPMGFLWRVAVPLVRPSLGALGMLSFLLAWNQYLWPRLVISDESHQTVQVGLRTLVSGNVDQLPVAFAGTVIAAAPIFVLLVIFRRQIVRGLTAGAVKG